MAILAAIGVGLTATSTAYGWYSGMQASDDAREAARENYNAIMSATFDQEFINSLTEKRFMEEQSVQLGNIKAGVAKQNMGGTPGGEAYESAAERTAAADIFLLKYKDNLQVKNMVASAMDALRGGQNAASALQTQAMTNTVSNLGSMMFTTANWYDKWKAPSTPTTGGYVYTPPRSGGYR